MLDIIVTKPSEKPILVNHYSSCHEVFQTLSWMLQDVCDSSSSSGAHSSTMFCVREWNSISQGDDVRGANTRNETGRESRYDSAKVTENVFASYNLLWHSLHKALSSHLKLLTAHKLSLYTVCVSVIVVIWSDILFEDRNLGGLKDVTKGRTTLFADQTSHYLRCYNHWYI